MSRFDMSKFFPTKQLKGVNSANLPKKPMQNVFTEKPLPTFTPPQVFLFLCVSGVHAVY